MMFLGERGHRVVAHARRGHESGPPGLATTRGDELSADLLRSIQSGAKRVFAPSEGTPLTRKATRAS